MLSYTGYQTNSLSSSSNFMLRLVALLIFINTLLSCTKDTDGEPQAAEEIQNSTTNNKPSQNLPAPDQTYESIEWTDLIPQDDLDALMNPPEYLNQIQDGSLEDRLSSQLKAKAQDTQDRYQQALISVAIRPEFDNRYVRIPGFIVPLEFNDDQVITTFFLVPFFGACIHQPPPPPNQIIFADYEPGIKLETLFDPFWIKGKLSTTLMENEMATAAYSIDVVDIQPYYDQPQTPDPNIE